MRGISSSARAELKPKKGEVRRTTAQAVMTCGKDFESFVSGLLVVQTKLWTLKVIILTVQKADGPDDPSRARKKISATLEVVRRLTRAMTLPPSSARGDVVIDLARTRDV